jgi:hypothetical protein
VKRSVNRIVPSHQHGPSFDAPTAELPGNTDKTNIEFRSGTGGLHSAEN